jgi:hypothetical protein
MASNDFSRDWAKEAALLSRRARKMNWVFIGKKGLYK